MTYDAIEEVETSLSNRPYARDFEYGSRVNTELLARRGHVVTSTEHNERWCSTIKTRLREFSNVQVALKIPSEAHPMRDDGPLGCSSFVKSFENYVFSIDRYDGGFDLLIVFDNFGRSDMAGQSIDQNFA